MIIHLTRGQARLLQDLLDSLILAHHNHSTFVVTSEESTIFAFGDIAFALRARLAETQRDPND